jgi:hypothetical protein
MTGFLAKAHIPFTAIVMAFTLAVAGRLPAQSLGQSLLQQDLASAVIVGGPRAQAGGATPAAAVEVAGGAIDITSGAMIVTTSSFGFVPSENLPNEYGTVGVPEYGDAAIHDAILQGYGAQQNGVYWNGTNGIISSTAANDPNQATGVGWVDLAYMPDAWTSYRGVYNLNSGQSIIAWTYYGDVLLDGRVGPSALSNLFNNYLATTGGYLSANANLDGGLGPVDWYDADTRYIGKIGPSALSDIFNNYLLPELFDPYGPVPPSPAGFSPAIPVIPEPSSLALATMAIVTAVAMRKKLARRRAGFQV